MKHGNILFSTLGLVLQCTVPGKHVWGNLCSNVIVQDDVLENVLMLCIIFFKLPAEVNELLQL